MKFIVNGKTYSKVEDIPGNEIEKCEYVETIVTLTVNQIYNKYYHILIEKQKSLIKNGNG